MREIETKGLLDEEFARWFNKSCESATSRPELDPAPREGPRVVPRDSFFVGNQPHPSSCEVPREGYPREGIPRPFLEIPRDAAHRVHAIFRMIRFQMTIQFGLPVLSPGIHVVARGSAKLRSRPR